MHTVTAGEKLDKIDEGISELIMIDRLMVDKCMYAMQVYERWTMKVKKKNGCP